MLVRRVARGEQGEAQRGQEAEQPGARGPGQQEVVPHEADQRAEEGEDRHADVIGEAQGVDAAGGGHVEGGVPGEVPRLGEERVAGEGGGPVQGRGERIDGRVVGVPAQPGGPRKVGDERDRGQGEVEETLRRAGQRPEPRAGPEPDQPGSAEREPGEHGQGNGEPGAAEERLARRRHLQAQDEVPRAKGLRRQHDLAALADLQVVVPRRPEHGPPVRLERGSGQHPGRRHLAGPPVHHLGLGRPAVPVQAEGRPRLHGAAEQAAPGLEHGALQRDLDDLHGGQPAEGETGRDHADPGGKQEAGRSQGEAARPAHGAARRDTALAGSDKSIMLRRAARRGCSTGAPPAAVGGPELLPHRTGYSCVGGADRPRLCCSPR